MNLALNSDILDILTPDDLELLLRRKRDEMSKKEIISRYKLNQLPQPDGRWWARVDGKQYFRKSRVELENLILELNEVNEITICEIFDAYLKQRKEQVSSATWVLDKKYYDWYFKDSKLGNKPIKDLNIDDGYEFFEYVKSIKPDIKEKYWRNLKSSLDMIIKYSIQRGYINHNPFDYLTFHQRVFAPKNETAEEDTVFSAEEQEKVCEVALKDAENNENAIPLGIILLFHTGLRIGELLGAKWEDVVKIDGKPHLYIRRIQVGAVDEEGNIRGRETANRCKSKRSKRKVPLNTKCVELLDMIQKYNQENGFGTDNDDYMFYRWVSGECCLCTERSFAGRLAKYCRQIDMDVIKSPHDVRRTALTNLWLNGVPIKVIQLIAGHNSQKQTEDYLRITEKSISQYNYTEVLVKGNVEGFGVQDIGQGKIVQFRKRV